MDQQQFDPFLQALLYKSSSRVVVYVPGYYEENNGKTREKKAEMAVHMAAKVAIATPQLGPVAPGRETEEMEGSIYSNPVEIIAAMIEEEGNIEKGIQLGDSFNRGLMRN